MWLIPRNELTVEQLRAVEAGMGRHHVIRGAPGSGKTLALVHRAAYLSQKHHIPPERFRIFVFTNLLKQFIQSSLPLLNIPESCVMTLDAWCDEYYTRHIGGTKPSRYLTPDFPAIRNKVYQHMGQTGQGFMQYDFVFVDEGQDLDPISYQVLLFMAGHVTVCMDDHQQLYGTGSSEEEVLSFLGLPGVNTSFLETYRCSPYIHELSKHFLPETNIQFRLQFGQQCRAVLPEKELPLLQITSTHEKEKDRLADILRTRLGKNESIGVLFSTNAEVYTWARAMRKRGVEVETPPPKGERHRQNTLDFSNSLPKFMTYFSAKGLTFDTVCLPRLSKEIILTYPRRRIQRLLFVGITRASKWLYLSTTDYRLPDFLLEPFEEMEHSGLLAIQRSDNGKAPAPVCVTSLKPSSPKYTMADWF